MDSSAFRGGVLPRLPDAAPACRWAFPDPSSGDEAGLVAVGADLEPATLLAAYSRGLFPMPLKPGRAHRVVVPS